MCTARRPRSALLAGTPCNSLKTPLEPFSGNHCKGIFYVFPFWLFFIFAHPVLQNQNNQAFKKSAPGPHGPLGDPWTVAAGAIRDSWAHGPLAREQPHIQMWTLIFYNIRLLA